MYNYFIGTLGKYNFIFPQYEIMKDGLRAVEDRWKEFPNGGTVSLANISDREIKDNKNRLLKFRVDFKKDFHPGYGYYKDNSNKYQIPLSAINDFDKDEIIEIIDIDCAIEEFLNDKTKRMIRIKHKPNNQILLRYETYCYGPFEFMISDIENSVENEAYYTIKVFVNSGMINRYKISDLERYFKKCTFNGNDRSQFIYKLKTLGEIESVEQIDYFDDEELADFFKDLLDKSVEIESLTRIREQFLDIADSFSESGKLTEPRLQRICKILQTSTELSNYKIRLTEEYFKNHPNAQKDKEQYLETHQELLESIARENIQYEEKEKELLTELNKLKNEKEQIEEEIEDSKQKLSDTKAEIDKLGEQAIEQKKQEIEKLQLESEQKLENLKEDYNYYRGDIKRNAEQLEQMKTEYEQLEKNVDKKIIEWAVANRGAEIAKWLGTQLEMPEKDKEEVVIKKLENLKKDLTAEQIAEILCEKMEEAGRKIKKDDAYNYLISICQNYITVFAGKPGSGKTSCCELLAKALGLYDSRFAKILVERGWTSSKDLIGYYNPLTKEIEKTQPEFCECMQQLNLERKNNIVEAPYFVLLDEANLSPIEFYWSHFNHFYDKPSQQVVSYSNGEKYEFGSELKFLATINYDHTTADLSPRFLDRAWIISMDSVSSGDILNNLIEDSIIKNNIEIVSLENLNQAFDWQNLIGSDTKIKMNQATKDILDRIIDKMKEGRHTISSRSLKSIIRYYLVAEKYMSSKEVALDYAISQKILPCISGNGKIISRNGETKTYGKFLSELESICRENKLEKSANIISQIIERGEHEFYSFFSV